MTLAPFTQLVQGGKLAPSLFQNKIKLPECGTGSLFCLGAGVLGNQDGIDAFVKGTAGAAEQGCDVSDVDLSETA